MTQVPLGSLTGVNAMDATTVVPMSESNLGPKQAMT